MKANLSQLNQKEREILSMTNKGISDDMIALKTNLTVKTVNVYQKRILNKIFNR
jgi:DNA-binding NarL/FixJ family response regulator